MKILLGITYYYPNISGVTLYAKRLAEGLVKRGNRVIVLTSRHDPSLPKRETINGVEVIRSPVLLKIGKGVLMPFLPFQIFWFIRNCEVVNCHLPQFESFIFAVIGKFFGKKIILTHHTDLSGWKGFLNQLSEMAVWLGQLIAGAFADLIVPYTKDYADYSWYLRLFKTKLKYILPPILVGKIDKNLINKWKKEIGDNKYIIGFAGRIAKQKGIPRLLQAISFLKKQIGPNFKIVFAGPYKKVIGENYFKEIEDLIALYRGHLCFLGDILEDKMASFYSMCDVLVLPSDDRLESFGLVQAEAMLCGCPTVATNLPGVRIPIRLTGMGETVSIGDSRALAKGISMVLKKKEKYIKPKEEIEKIFNFDKTLEEYEKIFEEN